MPSWAPYLPKLRPQQVTLQFSRDRPKSSWNLPKWNLSVVLNELTKAPFEPMKDTDLKHFPLKTAFLLTLASGKRRSKIHAWVANKVSNLGQREKVALFPSSDFIAKNQLAREGSQSVSPVTIPALTTIVVWFLLFLPKRPYLVRQRQQYVSGISSSGITSPRSFPSDQLSSERKGGGRGANLLQQSLQESKSQGLGISYPIRMFG